MATTKPPGIAPSPALDYRIRRSSRAKRTRIVVRADRIEIVAPPDVCEQRIHAFVQAQQAWISAARLRISQRAVPSRSLAPVSYSDGSLLPYRGGHLRLALVDASRKTVAIEQGDDHLRLHVPKAVESHRRSDIIRHALEHWMKHQARRYADEMIARHAPRCGLHPRSLRIKTQKSRWGSCGPNDDINLNWLLMLAPAIVMEYVVVHELCHIRHKNHSRDFWALVSQHMPDYLQHRHWLKQHGASIMRGL
ncbi:MAG: M48 family metallopeptidase [Methylomonas sp.]|nr:M48 family metallopeptidase [Methylomonas sp.]PPD20037.1 MAG: metal-dependent hydrolase [Methylomonas sp.]PPD25900.1 MAG: metal-dependent hydrolase [Methylomonas sp.]PPD37346.1 MAG: metal-dependent hydrolase [Methylomonas sp.]PPD40131.1 MAG: metal-dependent hydrolase [Methylomonas sp.]